MSAVTLKEQYYANDNSLKRRTMAIKRTNADIWCSKAVRLRDGACVRCGNTETNQAMHIYGRRNKAVRYSLDNLLTGCYTCHRQFGESPVMFTDFCNQHLGEGHMEILREKSRGILKENKAVRDEIAKHYREQIKLKEQDPDYVMISYN